MKIAEIVGSYADREQPEIAPDTSLFQTIAHAFTRSGKVKCPLDQQLSDGQPNALHIPFLPHAASDDDPAADAISNTSTDSPTVPTGQILSTHHNPTHWVPVRWPETSFYRVE